MSTPSKKLPESSSPPEQPNSLSEVLDSAVAGPPTSEAESISLLPPKEPGKAPDRATIIGADGRWLATWALRFILIFIALALAGKALGSVWSAVLPVLLALLVTTVLWPPTRFLRKKGWPPALAATTVLVGFFVIIGGIFTAMAPTVSGQSKDLVVRAQEGIHKLQEWIKGPPLNLDTQNFNNALNEVTGFIQKRSSDIASSVFTGVSAASSIAITLVLMLILTFFFLKDGTRFLPSVRKALGPSVGWYTSEALSRVWKTLSGYIRTQAIVSLVDATFIGAGLIILHVPLALVLAVITFFAGFVPIVGAFTAGALAMVVALVSNGLNTALIVLVIIIAVQQLEGHILQPMLQSKAMNLHPAIVLLAVTLGSTLFGVVGAFLAVPVAATIAVLYRYYAELVSLRSGELSPKEMKLVSAPDTDSAKDSAKDETSKSEKEEKTD